MKACFLAAGRGSRLKADDLPKPLWEIGPGSQAVGAPAVTILERQILLLQSLGVSDIAVVIGWRKELVRERRVRLRLGSRVIPFQNSKQQ